jgi:small subunit ribosomal protein S17
MPNNPQQAPKASQANPIDEQERPAWYGNVISNKMQKTVVVAVHRFVPHPMYRKVLKRVTKLKAHDEEGHCKVGDRVKITETRPISKEKHWRVVQIMAHGQPEE